VNPLPWLGLYPLEVVAVGGALALAVTRWLPVPSRRPVGVAGAVSAGGAGVALLFLGLRWQLIPVLAVAALSVPSMVNAIRQRTPHRMPRWLANVGTLSLVGLVVAGLLAAWALPVPAIPKATGRYMTGTTVLQWTDDSREETATQDDPDDRRVVVAQLWYPAASNEGERAPYMGRTPEEAQTVASGLATNFGLPGFVLDGLAMARTDSVLDAEPAPGDFPVVLFSPGLGSVRGQNTAMAEELASRGYVVVGLDHPYDSAVVVLADGTVVHSNVTAVADQAEGRRIGLDLAKVRAQDLRFTLTQLAKSRFADVLDLDRVAVTGFSMGGGAALMAASQDHRFAAVIDIDGFPYDPDPRPFPQPALILNHPLLPGESPDFLPKADRVLALGEAAGYRLEVPGTTHLTFTDAPMWLPPVPNVVGTRGRHEGSTVTTEVTALFLDHVLRNGGPESWLRTELSRYGSLHPAGLN
jgi:hypothetical protein